MPRAKDDRVSALVRGSVLVAASILLGTAAHLWAAGWTAVPFGPLLVMAVLLALLVSGVVAVGTWLSGHLSRRRWADALDDAAATVGLLAGQAFVHAVAGPVQPGLRTLAVEHAGHPLAVQPAGHPLAVAGTSAAHGLHGAHSSGWAMPVAHLCAALTVGLLLRWLEACVSHLGTALTTVRHALGAALLVLRPAPRVAEAGEPSRALAAPRDRLGLVLRVLAADVVRRGPPLGVAVP